MRKALLLSVFLFSLTIISAQKRGIHLNAGIASAKNSDIWMTPDGTAHTGIFIGLASRLRPAKKFSIYGAGKYVDLEFVAHESDDWFTRTETIKMLKFRLGGLYKVMEFKQSTYIRVNAAIPINLNLVWPTDLPAAPYNRMNTFDTGLVLGIGADIRGITIDFEYEIGVLDQITDVSGSRFRYWDLGIGASF